MNREVRKGKPFVRRGRKATGLYEIAGLPKLIGHLFLSFLFNQISDSKIAVDELLQYVLREAPIKGKPLERVGRKASDLLGSARVEHCDKGKPGAIPGRKATGLF